MCEDVWCNRSVSCEDIIASVSLPIILEQEECSVSAGDYVDRKRHQHEEVFKNMREELDQLNENVDKEVQQFIEVAKEELQLLQREIHENGVDEIKSVEEWLSVSKKNEKRKIYISKIISELSRDLESFEKSRSEEIIKLLTKYKEDAIAIRFTNIESIEQSFEEEIKNINLNMVKKFRRYEDVNVQLQVEGQRIIDKCQKNTTEKSKEVAERKAQELWKKVQEKQSRKVFNEAIYSLAQEKFRIREDFSQVANSLAKGLLDFAEGLQLPVEYEMRGEYWEQWNESLNARLASLDTLCKNVEMLLKAAVSALVENFDNQVNELSRTTGIKMNNHLDDLDFEISNEIDEFRNCQAKELQQLQEKWQVTVDLLNKNIERSKTFILDLTEIWTSHKARVNKLRNHIESTLESSYTTSLKKYKEKDAKLKGFLKSVREAKDLNKLNELCETLKEKFQEEVMDLEDSYESQLEMMEEMKRKGVEELIQEKQSHINDFLYNKYPKKEWFFDGRTSAFLGSTKILDSDCKMDTQIDLCNTYIMAVENRTLGMYEMLERYSPRCEASVREETEDWMNMFIQDIVNNYDSKVNEVNAQQTKILKDIKQIRFAEIQIHSRRLASHINGTKHEFSELNKWYDNVKTKQTASLKEFNEMVTSRLSTYDMKKIKNIIIDLEREWNCLSETLTNNIVAGKALCEKKYMVVKEASDLFLKTAKNFKNGGNYSPEELKTLNKELNQLGKSVLSQNKTIQKNYDSLAKLISRTTLDIKIKQINEDVNEFKLQQSIIDDLNLLRMRLRSEINTMKKNIKTIDEKISLLASFKRIEPCLVNEILTLINQTHDYMVFPEGVSSLECTKVEENLVPPIPPPVNNTQRNKSVALDTLFNHTTDKAISDVKNFLTITKGLILKKYYHLHQAIQERNTVTHSEVVKTKPNDSKQKGIKEKIKPDVEEHRVTLLKHVLRLYNSECELEWLSQTREFLDQTVTLRKVFNGVAELELTNNHENYMKSLDEIERDYLHSVDEGEPKKKANREQVRRSLVLPLVHPANHAKLSELREKAKHLGQEQKNEYKTHLTNYKNDLQHKHDSYVRVVKALKDGWNDLQTPLFGGDFCKRLIENSKDVRDVIPYEDVIGEEALNANPVYPPSIWSDGRDLVHGSETPPRSICLILLPTSAHASRETLSGGSGDDARVSVDRILAGHVKESAQRAQTMYDRAKESAETRDQTVQNWLKSFEDGVKEAKKFYDGPCNS